MNDMGQPATLSYAELALWLEYVANSWDLDPYQRGIAMMLALTIGSGDSTPAAGITDSLPDYEQRRAAIDHLCLLGLVDPHGYPMAVQP
jgi:hypothetical protein